MASQIIVASLKSDSPTDKGKLLENLTAKLLEIQNYSVKQEIRNTGAELDLLCVHKTNNKEIYVECKAYNEPEKISSEVITKLVGIKNIKKYKEAWLVTTSPLTKDAEGLVDDLVKNNNHDFSFYTPVKLIEAYINGKIIDADALSHKIIKDLVKDDTKIGDASLVISGRGNFWAIEYLEGGLLKGFLFTNAKTSDLVEEESILNFFSEIKFFSGVDCLVIKSFLKSGISTKKSYPKQFILSDVYIRKTSEIGMRITHPDKDVLSLEDVFVYPNLELIEDERRERIDSRKISEIQDGFKKCIIFGEDLSGKTTLAQKIQKDLSAREFLPIYINAEDIKRGDLNKFINLLKGFLKKQYLSDVESVTYFEEILEKEISKIYLIIDNYESLGIKRIEEKIKFQKLLTEKFENVIIFANKSMEIEMMANSEMRKGFADFAIMKIKQFGHVLRDELIEKWLLAGDDDGVFSDSEIHNKKIEISEKIRIAVGTNFIPTYPLYLLTILQLIETASKNKLQGSSYAELYTYLIIQSLGSVNAKPEDLDFYLTYLSYLAYFFFRKNQKVIPLDDLQLMYEDYCKEMHIDKDFKALHALLNNAQIIRVDENTYSFNHNYSYYFFVAKYFSDNLENTEIKESIEKIIKHLYRSEYANILIFLVHHSKNKSILEKIVRESLELFKDTEPYRLTNFQSSEISKLISKEIGFSIEDEKPSDYRKRDLAERDKVEDVDSPNDDEGDRYKTKNDLDLFGEINLAFKIMEIMGQITNNYYGSLEGSRKIEIINEIQSLGFRALTALLEDFEKFKETLKIEIRKVIEKKKILNDADKERAVNNVIYNFTEMLVYVFLKRISDSVTSKNIFPTLDIIAQKDLSPGNQLVYLSTRLNFPNGINSKEIIELDRTFAENHLVRRILRLLVVEYLYKFDMKISEKQSLCDKLDIKLIQNRERLG